MYRQIDIDIENVCSSLLPIYLLDCLNFSFLVVKTFKNIF